MKEHYFNKLQKQQNTLKENKKQLGNLKLFEFKNIQNWHLKLINIFL